MGCAQRADIKYLAFTDRIQTDLSAVRIIAQGNHKVCLLLLLMVLQIDCMLCYK